MPQRLSPDDYVRLTHALLNKYDLPATWQVKVVAGMGRRLGTCNYSRQLIRLSKAHLETSDHEAIVNTVRHEVAHALAHQRSGSAIKPHGPEWKAAARELGAVPRASVPLTDQQRALQDATRTLDALLSAKGLPASKPRSSRRKSATFVSRELGRKIAPGDHFTLRGTTYEVVATKRTRFTGISQSDGRLYSIPAQAINKGNLQRPKPPSRLP